MIHIEFAPKADLQFLTAQLNLLDRLVDIESIIILSGEHSEIPMEAWNPLLQGARKPVIGGIFPKVLHGTTVTPSGCVVVGLPFSLSVVLLEDISAGAASYESVLDRVQAGFETACVFVDGLADGIGELMEALFMRFGVDANYIGGGAGSLSLQPQPCVLSNAGISQNAAVLGLAQRKTSIGVNHGWEELSDPIQVTRSTGRVVHELNYKPTFSVYSETVATHSNARISTDSFFEHAQGFPLGLLRHAGEYIVRDAIATDESGSLICVGDVPEGSFVVVLTGSPESLIEAAARARARAWSTWPSRQPPQIALVMDCISRTLYLKESLEQEIYAIWQPAAPMAGAFSIGEVANMGRSFLEFYNKTTVVGLL